MTVPGPRQRYPGEFALAVMRRPLAFFTDLARTYGDVAGFRIAEQPVVLVSHPDRIRDVLVTHGRNFHKGRGLERAKMLLGEGLLTSEGDFHLRQRRLVQPAFHRERIAAYADTMATYAARMRDRWRDGDDARRLARDDAASRSPIVGKTLFDADVEREAARDRRRRSPTTMEAFNFERAAVRRAARAAAAAGDAALPARRASGSTRRSTA